MCFDDFRVSISWCSSNPFTFLGHLFDLLDVFFSTLWERVGDCFAGTCGDVLGAAGKS